MQRNRPNALTPPASLASLVVLMAATLTVGACGESREDIMRRQMGYDSSAPADGSDRVEHPKIPAHPTRDALAPLLTKIYVADALPAVQEAEVEGEGDYAITNPGLLAVVNIRTGKSKAEQAKAIIKGVAEADGYALRNGADLYFPEQLNKVKISFGADQRDLIGSVYGDLRLLDFFASDEADATIAALDADLQGPVNELKAEYLGKKDEIWAKWMSVKMHARRIVAYDQPFMPVLRSLRKSLEMKEPDPISWTESHDQPFAAWAKAISDDEELFKMLTNLPKLREQIKFREDTHTRWAVVGSALIPDSARKLKIDEELGFGVHREDLGGGEQEMTFVFAEKLRGNDLKEAYLRSQIYRQMFSDFATLSAAGGDFEGGEIPDAHDPDYAYCASRMALDGLLKDYGKDKPILDGLKPKVSDEDKLVTVAVDCLLARIPKGINRGVKDDLARPPAPYSRTAFFQMLARFTKATVDLDNMKKDVQKSQEVLDAEALLKAADKKKRG